MVSGSMTWAFGVVGARCRMFHFINVLAVGVGQLRGRDADNRDKSS